MEPEFQSDGIHTYVVLKNNMVCDDFKFHMLDNHDIRHLARVKQLLLNDEGDFYYLIDGSLCFKNCWESKSVSYQMAYCFFMDLFDMLLELHSYMLSVNDIVLETDCIFFNEMADEFVFLYYPGYNRDFKTQATALVKAMMVSVDYADNDCNDFLYGVYQLLCEENKGVEQLGAYISSYDEKRLFKQRKCAEEKSAYMDEDVDEEPLCMKNKDADNRSMEKFFFKALLCGKNYETYKIIMGVSVMATAMAGAAILFIQYAVKGNLHNPRPLFGVLILIVVEILVCIDLWKREDTCLEKEVSSEEKDIDLCISEKTSLLPCAACAGDGQGYYALIPIWECASEKARCTDAIYVTAEKIVVGRNCENNGYINNQCISRQHALIFFEKNQLLIEDLNSTNGTYVNEYPIYRGYPVMLQLGDRVRFGNESFVLQYIPLEENHYFN